jgi:3-hydroxyacyl-[acyl-carrier-protein] dehydratase
VKELASMVSGEKLQLKKGSNVKFLQLIDPHKNPVVVIKGNTSKSESEELTVSATISNEESAFFKFKGQFV